MSRLFFGTPGGTRTHDPQIRNLVLYPAELRGHPDQAGDLGRDRKIDALGIVHK